MSGEATFESLLATLLEARDRGEDLDVDALAREHPAHAAALRAHVEAESWLADLARGLATGGTQGKERPIEPPDLEGFTIRREIARGGMGVVFEAEQHEPRRVVALKTLRDAVLATDEDVRRFRREAQAAAELDHPGIVRILEVGSAGRRVWYTMPLAAGGSLREAMDAHVGRPREAAMLVRDVARAVAHGHARGILHRDLKPSNVLLDRRGTPLVADFGLARRIGPGIDPQTRTGTVLGTPAYMAPEQARGDVRAIDERTDIWSLGAVLHELLTGRPPFVGEGPGDTIDRVLNSEAPPVRATAPGVPPALAAVCDQCLRKDPGDRYASMRDLADDLDRFLRGDPVRARTPGPVARASAWVKRRASAVTVAGALVVALLALGFGLHAFQAGEDRDRVRRADDLLATATRLAEEGDSVQAALYFAAADRLHPSDRAKRGLLAHIAPAPLAVEPTQPGELWRVRWSPSGEVLAAGSATGHVYLWAADGTRTELVHTEDQDVRALAFDATGARIATGDEEGVLRVWDAHGRRELARVRLTADDVPSGPVFAVAWLDEGRLIAGGADGRLHTWTIGASFTTATPRLRSDHEVRALARGAADERLWVGLSGAVGGGRLHTYDMNTQALRGIGVLHDGPVWDVASDRENGHAYTVDNLGLRRIDASEQGTAGNWPHAAPVGAVAFDPRESRVATGTVAGRVRTFSMTRLEEVGRPLQHPGQVYGVAIHPTDGRIATVGIDGAARIWPRPEGPGPTRLRTKGRPGVAFAYRADDAGVLRIATPPGEYEVDLVPRPPNPSRIRTTLGSSRGAARHYAASGAAEGWLVLTGHADRTTGAEHLTVADVRRAPYRDAPDGSSRIFLRRRSGPPRPIPARPPRTAIDGRARLALVEIDGRIRVHRIGDDLSLADPRISAPCDGWFLSPRGTWLLLVDPEARNRFTLEQAHDGSKASTHTIEEGEIARGDVSPDGTRIALSLRDDRRVVVYDVPTRRLLSSVQHRDVLHVHLAGGGALLVTSSGKGPIRVWEAATGLPVGRPLPLPLDLASTGIERIAIAPAGGRLMISTRTGALVELDVPWLLPDLPDRPWSTLHTQAELAAMRTIGPDGRARTMPLDTWRRLRARHGP